MALILRSKQFRGIGGFSTKQILRRMVRTFASQKSAFSRPHSCGSALTSCRRVDTIRRFRKVKIANFFCTENAECLPCGYACKITNHSFENLCFKSLSVGLNFASRYGIIIKTSIGEG